MSENYQRLIAEVRAREEERRVDAAKRRLRRAARARDLIECVGEYVALWDRPAGTVSQREFAAAFARMRIAYDRAITEEGDGE